MGYLSNGHWIESDSYDQLSYEIQEEARRLYREKYGKRNPDTLSTMELENIKTKAGQRVMARRRRQ